MVDFPVSNRLTTYLTHAGSIGCDKTAWRRKPHLSRYLALFKLPSWDSMRPLGLVFPSGIGKNAIPVGHGTAEKVDDQDCGDEGDDKRHLPEPEDVIECPGTQAGHDDDCA